MELLKLIPGTQEWIDYRMECYSASYAPVVMGEERYLSRNQLLDHYKGWTSEVNDFTKSIFEKGHKAEDGARPIVSDNEFIDLRVVVAVVEIEGLKMLASYDGAELHLEGTIVNSWEHKLYNQVLYENVRNNVLEAFYYWQLEHQMMVADTDSCLFTCSNGTGDLMATMIYHSDPERRTALIKAWLQFDEDLKSHEMVARTVKLEKIKIKSLPELKVNVLSEIKSSNLSEYTTSARRFIASINTELETDKDFEDASVMVKHLSDSEKVLKKVKQSILDDNVDIKAITEEIESLQKYSAGKRLSLSKLIKEQKDLKKENLKLNGRAKHQESIAKLMVETNNINVGFATPDFDLAIKGLSNFSSMESAIDTAIANVNISNKDLVEKYLSKKNLADEMITDYKFLFLDVESLLLNSKEGLINIIENTILKYKAKLEDDKRKIQEKLDNLNSIPDTYIDKPNNDVLAKIKSLAKYKVEKDDFGDMYKDAIESVINVISKLTVMHFNESLSLAEELNNEYNELHRAENKDVVCDDVIEGEFLPKNKKVTTSEEVEGRPEIKRNYSGGSSLIKRSKVNLASKSIPRAKVELKEEYIGKFEIHTNSSKVGTTGFDCSIKIKYKGGAYGDDEHIKTVGQVNNEYAQLMLDAFNSTLN